MTDGRLDTVLRHLRRLAREPDGGDLTDRQLLQRFAAGGDEAAFAALVQRHGPMVLGVGRRLLGAADAEDAFQATFLVLARRAQAVQWQDSVGGWLYAVAYRIARRSRADAARRRARERQPGGRTAAEPPDELLRWELRRVLDEELSRLPAKYRSPLLLCYLEGKTNEEAARLLGWPIGSMSRRLARGRQLLRDRLIRRGLALTAAALAGLLAEEAGAGGLPAPLAAGTLRAAVTFAAGATPAAGPVSVPAAALAEGVLHSMPSTRILTAVIVLVVLGVLGVGTGLFLHGAARPDGNVGTRGQGTPAAASDKEEKTAAGRPDAADIRSPVRILLFAAAPTRDYQFARSLFVRDVDRKRAELSIRLQDGPGGAQDVPPERLLKDFPASLRTRPGTADQAESRYADLARYDVVVAFDPDWTKVKPEQLELLEKWVRLNGGGLIVAAGPVNTLWLARPAAGREKLKPLLDLYPVDLEDARLVESARSTTDPWRLNFSGAGPGMSFLKLDEAGQNPLAGWEEFFGGRPRGDAAAAGQAPERGFFTFYPVKAVKPNATVVATFSDPQARLADGKEMPYLVSAPHGNGRVVYLGSGETWRLREYSATYHERFWTGMVRYAAAGSLGRLVAAGKLSLANLSDEEKEVLWTDLMRRDAPAVSRAYCTLTAVPAQTVPFLAERLKPVTDADLEGLTRALADLDSEQFAVREGATRDLERLGVLAEPALRESLSRPSTSLEARTRIQAVLGKLEAKELSRGRRALRGIDALEETGTPEARRLLEKLAGGTDRSQVTRAAKAALERSARP
jgi:RNA polymerase sigma factor (sigma-70 family)